MPGIFEAELRGKRPVSEISEDELTSRIFGTFDMLDRHILSNVLGVCGWSLRGACVLAARVEIWPQEKTAWPGISDVEPDVLISWPGGFVVVECKLGSGLLPSQLQREYYITDRGEDRHLLYLTDEFEPPDEFLKFAESLGSESWRIRFLSYREIYGAFSKTIGSLSDNVQRGLSESLGKMLRRMGYMPLKEYVEKYREVANDQDIVNGFNGLKKYCLGLQNSLKKTLSSSGINLGSITHNFGGTTYFQLIPSWRGKDNENLAFWISLHHPTLRFFVSFCDYSKSRRLREFMKEKRQADIPSVPLTDPSAVAERVIEANPDFNDLKRTSEAIAKNALAFLEEYRELVREYSLDRSKSSGSEPLSQDQLA